MFPVVKLPTGKDLWPCLHNLSFPCRTLSYKELFLGPFAFQRHSFAFGEMESSASFLEMIFNKLIGVNETEQVQFSWADNSGFCLWCCGYLKFGCTVKWHARITWKQTCFKVHLSFFALGL